MVIPVDRVVNCKRMLATGRLQTEHFHADECLWLVKYLRDKRYPESEIFEKWKFFWSQHKTTYDDDDFKCNFKSFSGNARNVIFNKYLKIEIFQEEIDYINSLPLPLWMRQYIYVLLLHSKATGNNKYDSLPYDDYHWWLDIKNRHDSDHKAILAVKLKELGIVKIVHIVEHYESFPEINNDGELIGYAQNVDIINDRLQFLLPVQITSTDSVKYETILDALNDMVKINNLYRCPLCGTTFQINNKTKRYICDDCYLKNRKKAAREIMKKKYIRKS